MRRTILLAALAVSAAACSSVPILGGLHHRYYRIWFPIMTGWFPKSRHISPWQLRPW